MTRCAVDGCNKLAIGELYDINSGKPSPRCRDCLELDLDADRFHRDGGSR